MAKPKQDSGQTVQVEYKIVAPEDLYQALTALESIPVVNSSRLFAGLRGDLLGQDVLDKLKIGIGLPLNTLTGSNVAGIRVIPLLI